MGQVGLVELRFPIGRDPAFGAGDGLAFGMGMWGRQLGALDHALGVKIVEPMLAGLEAGDDVMAGFLGVFCCVLIGGTVAAADVSALGAAAEVVPPTV